MKEHREAKRPTIIFTTLRRFQIKMAARIRIIPSRRRRMSHKSTSFV